MRGGQQNASDNERRLRSSHHESDGELFASSNKRHGGMFDDSHLPIDNGRNSDPNLLYPNRNKASGNKHRRGSDEEDYIVGPESNLSSIKKRPSGHGHGNQD